MQTKYLEHEKEEKRSHLYLHSEYLHKSGNLYLSPAPV